LTPLPSKARRLEGISADHRSVSGKMLDSRYENLYT
jgi:hypothetical protein